MSNKAERNNTISVLKFFAVVSIIVLHCFVPVGKSGKILFEGAYILCDFFFILQGYFLYDKGMNMSSEKDCIGYVKKIWITFFPIVLMQSIILLVIDLLLKNPIGFNYMLGIISQLSFVTVLFPIVRVQNGALWFLSAYTIAGYICLLLLLHYKAKFAYISFLLSCGLYNYIILKNQTIDVWHEIGIFGSPYALFRGLAGCCLGIFTKCISSHIPKLNRFFYSCIVLGGDLYSFISF